jgi:hypothetical protein
MMYMKTKTKLDLFGVASGKLVIGDPCYGGNQTLPALDGRWTAHVTKSDEGDWGIRVSRVIVHHVDYDPSNPRIKSIVVGFCVDSGQAGVFDVSTYGGAAFYERCCSATLSEEKYGFVHGGFVTSSGYGDGGYEANVQAIDGKAVCVELIFIDS